jgi:putative membrane protein
MKMDQLGEALVTSAAVSVVGLLVFCLAFFLMEKLSPFSVRKEIEEDHNISLAIIMAAVIIGIAMIVSSAVTG